MKKLSFLSVFILACVSLGMTSCSDDGGSKFDVPKYTVGEKCDSRTYEPFCDGNKHIECYSDEVREDACSSSEICLWFDSSEMLLEDIAGCYRDDEFTTCEKAGEKVDLCHSSDDRLSATIVHWMCMEANDGKRYLNTYNRDDSHCEGACTSESTCKLKPIEY